MIVFEILAELLSWLLPLSWGQERGGLERSPWERHRARAGYWVAGGILFLAVLIAVYAWASHRL